MMVKIFSTAIIIIGVFLIFVAAIAVFPKDPAEAHREKVQKALRDMVRESTIDNWYQERRRDKVLIEMGDVGENAT